MKSQGSQKPARSSRVSLCTPPTTKYKRYKIANFCPSEDLQLIIHPPRINRTSYTASNSNRIVNRVRANKNNNKILRQNRYYKFSQSLPSLSKYNFLFLNHEGYNHHHCCCTFQLSPSSCYPRRYHRGQGFQSTCCLPWQR